MRKINEQFAGLPREYFAKKFTNPNFPPMSPGISWGMILANMLFYIMNFVQCIDDEAYLICCTDGEIAVMKYTAIGVMTIAALMFAARIYWGKKAIAKHKVGYIHFNAWLFGELRLQLLSAMTIWAAALMSDGIFDQETIPIINAVYIGAAVLLVADIVLNIVFWEVMKRKIIEGAFKENGKGFFGDIKNKGKRIYIFERVGRVIMTMCLAFIPLSRFLDIRWDTMWNPVLAVVLIAMMIALWLVLAYADALLLGRAHYVGKFESQMQECEN